MTASCAWCMRLWWPVTWHPAEACRGYSLRLSGTSRTPERHADVQPGSSPAVPADKARRASRSASAQLAEEEINTAGRQPTTGGAFTMYVLGIPFA